MSTLTKEQWTEIEKKMSGVFGSVGLLIDGYKILLMIQHTKMRLIIAVYVNGHIRGEWFTDGGTEEARRFFWPRKRYIYPMKVRKTVKKRSKAFRDGFYEDINKTITNYWPWWNSFKALKAHLIRNNKSIELIEDDKQ